MASSGLYPIKLAAVPDAWWLFSVRSEDPAFESFKQRVFERDQYTCRYCGFQAPKCLEVVNLDNNYRNNKLSNLVTACSFCAQCNFLETIGKDERSGGVLIYLPEIRQNDLNGACHVLFCAMFNVTDYGEDAQNIYRSLKLRSQLVEQLLGEGMSDPSLFGCTLLDSSGEEREKIEKKILGSLRLLPSYSKFNQQIRMLSESAIDELSVA